MAWEGDVILIVSAIHGALADTAAMTELRERMQPLLLKYGAERVSSARVLTSGPDDPHEVHIMRFSTQAYDAMLADPDYVALDNLRAVAMDGIRTYVAEEYVTFVD
jgi:hypothetical protein